MLEGVRAKGAYDLKASLHSTANEQSPIGPALEFPGVDIQDGAFSLQLDFGPGAFDGTPRWIELAVRPTGTILEFTALLPRQPLSAVPYALYALNGSGTKGEKGDKGDKGDPGERGEKGDPGSRWLADTDLFFRGEGNGQNGIGWFGDQKPFGPFTPNGPVLYGDQGGGLGTTGFGAPNLALRWDTFGTVAIGNGAIPGPFPLHVASEGGQGDQFVLGSPRLGQGDTTLVMGLTAPQGGSSYVQAIAATGSAYGDLLTNPDGGRVGIRTRNPSAELEVNGTVKAKAFEGDGANLRHVKAREIVTLHPAVGWGDSPQADVPPEAMDTVIAIAAGGAHSLALNEDGTVVAWGANANGQCNVPPSLTQVTKISAGGRHSLALKQDGTVVGWGDNTKQQIEIPANLTDIIDISAGEDFSIALRRNGTVVGWGNNDKQQIAVPAGLTNVVKISAGFDHCYVVHKNGTLSSWGNDDLGQRRPSVVILAGALDVKAGGAYTMVLMNTGQVYLWGGDGIKSPLSLPAITDGTAIALGMNHALVLTRSGTVFSQGGAISGSASVVPADLREVTAVAAGAKHSLALRTKAPYARRDEPNVFLKDLTVLGSVSATAFNTTSDRAAKENFAPIDPQAVLAKVASLPISQWNFKNSRDTQHIGPMAQDFFATFGVGTDDRHIATVDADGVALAAIQALHQGMEQLRRTNQDLERKNQALLESLGRLENRLDQIQAGARSKQSQPLHPSGDQNHD